MPSLSFSKQSLATLALLAAAGLFFGASSARAQNAAASNQAQAAPATEIVATGCLQSAGAKAFTLTDASTGETYNLTSDGVDLGAHVGHTVKVTGTDVTNSASDGADNGGGAPAEQAEQKDRTLNVTSLEMVSKTCSDQSAPGPSSR